MVQAGIRHTRWEDAHALLMGAFFIALALLMLQQAGLVVGGAAGIALLLHYLTGLPTGILFALVNLPFYGLALRTMGWEFTIKTFLVNLLLLGFGLLLPRVLRIDAIDPLFAALGAGTLAGMGVLALARHRSSVGGVSIVALYFHERGRWRAGRVQMTLDCLIVAASLLVLEPGRVALSVLASVALSLVLVINHKPGRYAGF